MRTGILFIALICVIAQSASVTNDGTVSNQTVTTPIVISGYVSYARGAPVGNPDVTVTNLNTSENFTVMKSATSNYYRAQTISTNLNKGDQIRFNVNDGTNYNETVYEIAADDLKDGVFMQNLMLESEKSDLIITNCSVNVVSPEGKTINITYTVKNIGDTNAGASTTTIYIDDHIPASDDPVGPLAPGKTYTSTVGPIGFPHNSVRIMVCADNESAVDEISERNNCAETELNCSLPNLYLAKHYNSGLSLWEWVDEANGRFNISYRVTNRWCGAEARADASNTTINITTFMSDGSASSVIIKDPVPALPLEEEYHRILGPFTCSCNHTVMIEVCADGDKKILETNENDNCLKSDVFFCPASASMPDLKIIDRAVTWVNHTKKIFNVTYTVANIGSANASESTTYIHGTNYPVPELAPGENYSSTFGPFLLGGDKTTVNICADYYDSIAESNEDNNCWNYSLAVPDLKIWFMSGNWIDGRNKTYSITYTVRNDGYKESNVSKVFIYIDGNLSKVTDHPPVPGGNKQKVNTTGPFTMTGDSDMIRVCVKWEHGRDCDPRGHEFLYGGCLAEDGSLFTCGDHVNKSCTFTGDMRCRRRYSGTFPNGILIGKDDIVIDGNGSAIIGEGCDVLYHFDSRWIGINNRLPGDTHPGYKNVTIKNLEVRNFHIGVSIANADYNTLKNCSVHDNGDINKYNYGITAENSDHITVDNCSVYNNTGTFTYTKESAGHGINFDSDCNHCNVTNSSIVHNYLSGIYASPTCKYLSIRNNLIEDNGYCGRSRFCTGINLHWRGGYGQVTNSTVLGNAILNNTGPGIYVTQGYTTIKDNIVRWSTNGTNVTGDGIFIDNGKVTFLYNNTACDNCGIDIANKGFATFGDDNTCDTTEDYDDEGTIGCIFYCGGANGVCVGTNYNFSCGMVVNESCRFNRSVSCMGCGGDGLIAGADDITIDGAGYTITGNFSGTGIFSNHENVTIKSLQAKDFSTGIEIGNTINNMITNCNLRKNQLFGINFSADNGTLRDNRIYDNNGSGIVVGGDYNILLNNIVALNNGYGIYFSPYTENNTITTNAIGDNVGIDIYNSQTNIGDNNTCDTTHDYWDTSMLDKKYGCTYPWTPPDLIISRKWEDWVDKSNKTYNITYTIKNIGKPKSREAGSSTTWLHIDRHHVGVADDRVGSLSADESKTGTFDYTAEMSDDRDKIVVCADGADEVTENNDANKFYCNGIGCYIVEELFCDKEKNNCKENTFEEVEEDLTLDEGAACVADDGTAYRCGDLVTKSCTFNGSMRCPAGDHGLNIEKGGITIDGDGFALIGPGNASCANFGGSKPSDGDYGCGIYNSGFNDVTITNLEIVGFCNGIGVKAAQKNTIDDCNIHGNGNPDDGRSHGIHIVGVRNSLISNNEIYENTGVGDDCEAGGNGIFLYECCDNIIEENEIYENRKGGIFIKMMSKHNDISDNEVYENCQGGIILRCVNSNDNTIENNNVLRNYGDGIYIRGDDNTVWNNRINDNTAGFKISSGDAVGDGDGIDMSSSDGACRNEVYDNEVCGNDGVDIKSAEGENSGNNNYCDTTEHYHDDGCTGCTFLCADKSKPDLIITEDSEVRKNPDDEMYRVNYTVKNIGNANAHESTTRIWIDGNWWDFPASALNAGEINTSTVSLSGTSGVIDVCADREGGEGKINEIDEENNCRTLYALPDLIVTRIDVPGEISMILPNDATATVANIGTVETKGAFEVKLSVNNDHADTVTVKTNLVVGTDIPVTFTWTSALELNELEVFADSGNSIMESDDTNNNMTTSVGEIGGLNNTDGGRDSPKIYTGDGVPLEDSIQPGEVNPGEGVGGNWNYDETVGNESASGRAAKERVSAQLFRSNPFFGAVKEVVVSHSGITVVIALFIALLFYVGFRGELTVHRRNNR